MDGQPPEIEATSEFPVSKRDASDRNCRRHHDDDERYCQYVRSSAACRRDVSDRWLRDSRDTGAGVTLMAKWLGSHVLASIATKNRQVFALVTYEVSADGKTLTSRSSGVIEQMIGFDRK